MKKTFILTIYFVLLAISFAGAQSRILVHSGEQSQVFGTFAAALSAAQNGDIIYLPGGAIDIGNTNINKSLTIIGAGHYPEFAPATGITMLTGNIFLVQPDAETPLENVVLEGFHLSGSITLGTNGSNQVVKQLNIIRCNVESITLSYNGYSPTTSEQIHVIENVLRGNLFGGNAQNVLISKNIINGQIAYFNSNALFVNNAFLGSGSSYWAYNVIHTVYSAQFRNNVMLCGFCFANASANVISNNLFRAAFVIPNGSTGSGNVVNQPMEGIFVNHTGFNFSYNYDYHLKPGSPGIGAGSDGFDMGIYGSNKPYKPGAVPTNPQIISKSIASETDSQGKLQVEVVVEAQNE